VNFSFFKSLKIYSYEFLENLYIQFYFSLPRLMIPEAVFREFPAKTLRKLPASGWNAPGSARNSTQESGDRIRLSVVTGSCRFRAKPDKSVHQNTASMKSPEYHGTGGFLLYVFDLGNCNL
jgi:hypothetical protein